MDVTFTDEKTSAKLRVISGTSILPHLCIQLNKWGMLLSSGSHDAYEIQKAAPFLDTFACIELEFGDTVFVFCETQDELYNLYDQVVGDDGTTRLNQYNGEARVYALTCTPGGERWNENT